MANVNSVVVSGNLTRDPETKWTADDGESSIVNLGIAVNRSRKNKDTDEYEDEVSFFDCDVFGKYANLVGRKLRKGDAATISGRLEQQKFEVEGQSRSVVKIIVSQIDSDGFFRSKEEDAAPEAATEAPVAETAPQAPADDDIPF